MSIVKYVSSAGVITGIALALTACGTTEVQQNTEPQPVVETSPVEMAPAKSPESRAAQIYSDTDTANTGVTAVERRFAEGLSKYNDGLYSDAIKIFREPIFKRAWPELQVRSLKYLAFSYCVNNNASQCKRTFSELIKIEPHFDLNDAERGHPLWGPVFQQAKAESGKFKK